MEKKEPDKRGYGGIVATVIALVLVFLFLSPYRIFELPLEMSLNYMALPLIGFLSIVLVERTIKTFFSGSSVPPICDSLLLLAGGVYVLLLLRRISLWWTQSTATPIFLIVVLLSGYRVISHFLRENYTLSAFSKSLAFVIAGFILKRIFSSLISEAEASLSNLSSISSQEMLLIFFREVLPMSFIIGGAAISLYSLKKLDNDYLSVFGEWVKSHIRWIGFFGGVLWVYVFSAREQLLNSVGQKLLVAEWGLVGLFAAAMYITVRGSVKQIAEREQFESWKKHAQRIGSSEDLNQANIAKMIEDFIEKGKKERIITYLIRLAEKRGYSQRHIVKLTRELINYHEDELPPLILSWEAERIKEDNREERKEKLESVLERME